MARLASVNKNNMKKALIEKKKAKRDELRAKMQDQSLSAEEKIAVQFALQKLGRRSCATQFRNRCHLTGRPRGTLRDFGLARNMFRKLALEGKLPGVIKASW
jgi:small subunit ribosomal protein S14